MRNDVKPDDCRKPVPGFSVAAKQLRPSQIAHPPMQKPPGSPEYSTTKCTVT
jgi:hypothetical protein